MSKTAPNRVWNKRTLTMAEWPAIPQDAQQSLPEYAAWFTAVRDRYLRLVWSYRRVSGDELTQDAKLRGFFKTLHEKTGVTDAEILVYFGHPRTRLALERVFGANVVAGIYPPWYWHNQDWRGKRGEKPLMRTIQECLNTIGGDDFQTPVEDLLPPMAVIGNFDAGLTRVDGRDLFTHDGYTIDLHATNATIYAPGSWLATYFAALDALAGDLWRYPLFFPLFATQEIERRHRAAGSDMEWVENVLLGPYWNHKEKTR